MYGEQTWPRDGTAALPLALAGRGESDLATAITAVVGSVLPLEYTRRPSIGGCRAMLGDDTAAICCPGGARFDGLVKWHY